MKKIILPAVVVMVLASFSLAQANSCGGCEGSKKKDKSKDKTEETDSKAPKKS